MPAMPFHDDFLLRRWALDVAIDTVFVPPARRAAILDTVLPEAALGDLLDRIDRDELASLLRHLPAERWASHADALAERWPRWEGSLARFSAPLIARHRPETAAALFEGFAAGVADAVEPDTEKLVGVIEAARHLEHDHAHAVLTTVAGLFKDNKRLEFVDWQVAALADVALATRHPDRLDIVRRWLVRVAASEETFHHALVRLGGWLFGDASRVGFVRDVVMGYTRQAVAPLAGTVFRPDLSPVEIDNALRGLGLGDAKAAARLLQPHLELPPGGDTLDRWDDFLALVKGGLPHPEDRPAKRVWSEVFAFGGLLTALWETRLDLSAVGLETIWTVVAADIDLPPGLESALPRLQEAPREVVAEKLTAIARAGENTYAGRHAATLMGLLGHDEFLPVLIAGLNWEFEPALEAVEAALERYGDRAIAALDDDFERLEGLQPMMALGLASRLGSDAGVALIAKHVTVFVDDDADGVAMAATVLDAEPLNAMLADWLDEDVAELNRAFVVLEKLHGRADGPEIRDLVAKVERLEAEAAERQAAALKGDAPGFGRPALALPLACRACGQTRNYEIREIWITSDPADLKPFIAQDVPCTSCGAVSNFDFTPEALETIGAEAKRLGLNDLELYRFRDRWSVLKVRSFAGPAGVRRSVTDLIEEFEQHLAASPNDAGNHRSVGNLYIDTNRYTAAEEHFRRCLEIDPTYLEAYYGLAQVAEYRGDASRALDILLEGAKHGGTLACRRPVGWPTPAEFVADYIRLHHDIGGDAAGRPKLLPAMFKTRLGRNDPCPLGTGKKVKKCCGGGN